jgi:hypothetical protein
MEGKWNRVAGFMYLFKINGYDGPLLMISFFALADANASINGSFIISGFYIISGCYNAHSQTLFS